jgi:5-methylthioadenosine/S-adenosylhomocysteine deaminase
MIKSGTTLFNDMYWHLEGTARAVEEMGIRAVLSYPLIDLCDPKRGKAEQKKMEELYQVSRQYSSRIQFALGPHAIYTVSGESLVWAYQFAVAKDLLYHIHLSETQEEVAGCLRQHQLRPVFYLKKLGVLGPNVIAAHGVWLENAELDLLRDCGVKLVTNPTANLKLAVGGVFRYPEIRKRGIPVCLGSDGCASNNNLDILEAVKFLALLQKWKYNDPTLLPCQEAWELVTKEAYRIFRVDAGVIAEGKLADLMLITLQHPQFVPCHNIISNLVYAVNGAIVDTVICDGKVVMLNRNIQGEEEILAKAGEVASQLVSQ